MLPLLLMAAALPDFDAVAAAPQSHQVLMEDDRVRVLRVSIAPGATEPVHQHCWPSIMYFEQPAPLTYIVYAETEQGPAEVQRVDVPEMEAHSAVAAGAEGLHAVMNRGSRPFIAVRVEDKTAPCELPSDEAQ